MELPTDEASVMDYIRRSVQRKAVGKTRAHVAEKTEDAQGRERQAERGVDEPGGFDALRRAEWKHTEWRRIGSVMEKESMEVYNPEQDPAVRQWAQEREQRTVAQRARAEQAERERQEGADELHLFIWLDGVTARSLRALAVQHEVSVEQVVAQLAMGARVGEDGTVSVSPFTPSRS